MEEEIKRDEHGEDKEDKAITEKENKQLRNVFIMIGVLVFFFVATIFIMNAIGHFDYQGVGFDMDRKTISGKTIYRTSVPVNSEHKITEGESVADYNFYLRIDPRTLKNIPLEGELVLMPNTVINFTGDFNCNGDGIIAIANLINVLDVLGVKTIKDETAGCDSEGAYTFLQIQPGEESSIEQFGPSCYNLNINDCEILEVTEKYIVELLSEITENRLQ